MIWGICAASGFSAVVFLARGMLGPDPIAAGYTVAGGANLVLMAWLVAAFAFYRKRSADLAQLESVARSFE